MRRLARFPWPLLRIFALGAFAVLSVIWAIVRFYSVVRPPMLVPVVVPAADGGVTELPAPELIEWQDLGDAGF